MEIIAKAYVPMTILINFIFIMKKIMDVINELRGLSVSAPVSVGDVIAKNVAGTGADILSCADIKTDKAQ